VHEKERERGREGTRNGEQEEEGKRKREREREKGEREERGRKRETERERDRTRAAEHLAPCCSRWMRLTTEIKRGRANELLNAYTRIYASGTHLFTARVTLQRR